MTQEEKELLLKELSMRLPYGVKIYIDSEFLKEKSLDVQTLIGVDFSLMIVLAEHNWYIPEKIKPYLRPMSSMTEEEVKEFAYRILQQPDLDAIRNWQTLSIDLNELSKVLDWLNKKHFDYRGLIPRGLALEAPEGMYSNKNK